jgi:hypothetical protein
MQVWNKAVEFQSTRYDFHLHTVRIFNLQTATTYSLYTTPAAPLVIGTIRNIE